MQSLIRHFVANFVVFQKHSFSKFCLCETLEPLPVTSPSCVNIYTLAAKGLNTVFLRKASNKPSYAIQVSSNLPIFPEISP